MTIVPLKQPDKPQGEPEPQGEPGFCRTPAADEILGVLEQVLTYGNIGTVVGAAGVGKSTALKFFAEENPGTVYCAMNPAEASMRHALVRIAKAIDPATSHNMSVARAYGKICDLIEWGKEWGKAEMLLIDEAQLLNDKTLDTLRCIHDQTEVPIVFAGNRNLRERISADSDAAFAQFASRVADRVDIAATTENDVEALAAHYGIADAKALEWLRERCARTYGLRTMAQLLPVARDFAGNGRIAISHIKKAALARGGGA